MINVVNGELFVFVLYLLNVFRWKWRFFRGNVIIYGLKYFGDRSWLKYCDVEN